MENISFVGHIISSGSYYHIIIEQTEACFVLLSEVGKFSKYSIEYCTILPLIEQLQIFNEKFAKYMDLPLHLKFTIKE